MDDLTPTITNVYPLQISNVIYCRCLCMGTNKYIFCLHDLKYWIFIKLPRCMFDTSIIIKLQKGDFFCFFACECTANIISVTQIDQTEKVMEFPGLEKLGTTL